VAILPRKITSSRKIAGAVLTALSLVASLATPQAAVAKARHETAGDIQRGMWVWGAASLLTDRAAQDAFFDFSVAPHGDASRRITHVYLDAGVSALTDAVTRPKLRAFVKRAHSRAIQVEFLDGDANWLTSDTNKQIPIDRCRSIVDFNAGSDVNERLHGVHYDIEPHQLGASWHQNTGAGHDNYNDTYENNLIDILRSCHQMGLRVTNDTGTDYAYYVHDLWDAYMAGGVVDYISIMNYFNTRQEWMNGSGGVGGVAQNLALDTGGLPMTFGAEVQSVPELSDISFYQKGYRRMYQAFDDSTNSYAADPRYAGVAVHYYTPFTTMPEGSGC
jgi:hypothetical protein